MELVIIAAHIHYARQMQELPKNVCLSMMRLVVVAEICIVIRICSDLSQIVFFEGDNNYIQSLWLTLQYALFYQI